MTFKEPQLNPLRFFRFITIPFMHRLFLPIRLLLLVLSHQLAAQPSISYSECTVDSLVRLIQRGQNDSIRFGANMEFSERLQEALLLDSNVNQPFVFAPNISCVHAGEWRLVTWVVPQYDGDAYRFYGFLQKRNGKRGTNSLYVLNDSTEAVKKPESEKLSPEKWFGAAYYEVVTRRKKGNAYYTLIGWKGKDRRVTQKVLEVLYFDGEQPRFGAPIFKKEKVFRSRIVFSFTSQATMSLRYETSKRMIVFDHLSGPPGTPKNTVMTDPSLCGPDGSYDGYKFRGGNWQWFGDLKMKQRIRHR